jgi:hypothetical protein
MSSELARAVTRKDAAAVKRLLTAGADPNSAPIHTLIMMCLNGLDATSHEILEALLNAPHINLNAVSGPMQTPLLSYAAKLSSDVTITNLLLEKGADPNVTNKNNVTPLVEALQKANNLKNIQALLEGKADPNIPNKYGKCPIHFAIEMQDAEIVKLLLDNGASTESKYGGVENVIEYVRKNSAVPEIRALFGIAGPEGAAAAAALPPAPASSPGPKLSRTSAKSMARPGKCLDPMLAEEVNIVPLYSVFYIRQPNGAAHAYCLDSMTLNRYLTSYDYVFYRCKSSTSKTMLRITLEQVESEPIRRLDLSHHIYIRNEQAQKIKVGRAYILEPTTKLVGRLASHAAIQPGASVVGAFHCQGEDAENGYIYNIRELGTTKTRVARSSPGPKAVGGSRAKRRRRTYRKNRV